MLSRPILTPFKHLCPSATGSPRTASYLVYSIILLDPIVYIFAFSFKVCKIILCTQTKTLLQLVAKQGRILENSAFSNQAVITLRS